MFDMSAAFPKAGDGNMHEDMPPPEALMDRLSGIRETLAAELVGLADEDLAWRPAPDRWSVKEVLAHLLDLDERGWPRRLQAFAEAGAGEEPALPPTPPDEARNRELCLAHTAEGLLDRLQAVRNANLDRLRAVPAGGWGRFARHPKSGRVTLHWLVNRWAEHDAGHVDQIRRVKAALAGTDPAAR